MTPDELRLDETRSWLDRARKDLRAATFLTAGGFHAEALFHCQQAAEKALKGFLTFHQRRFRKTHILGELSPECLSIDRSLEPVIAQAEGLTQYAWRFRYPGAPYEPDGTESGRALEKAASVVTEIERRLVC